MPFKRWEIARGDLKLASILAEECGIGALAASVLVAREHGAYADAMQFLTPGDELSSPFELADMEKAAERLRQAADAGEPITVYGDYDCDGVTSTVILYTYLSSIGADVSYYIPERDGEGYGLNAGAVERLAAGGTKLLVTVDNGISALTEIALANSLGMEVVVTDHHQPGEILPEAYAVVNPHRADCPSEFKELAGVGVACKLIAAMEGGYQTALDYFADIVALGTVGDVVPLVGENRTLVKLGLRALSMSDNIGLLALMEAAGVNPQALSAQTLAFSLAPRINAAGRMGKAKLAVQLLLSEDGEEAARLAAELDQMNRDRQAEEAGIIAEAQEQLRADRTLLSRRVLVLKSDCWNHGIIGIVCSKLAERYGKPVLLMTGGDGTLKGSARSVGNFHLFKALAANAPLLTQYGGHKLAAGFSLPEKNFDAFVEGIEAYARQYHDVMPQPTCRIDRELSPDELTLESVGSLGVLEPFGNRNEAPLFLIKNATLTAITPLSGDKHQRLTLQIGNQPQTALWFGMPSDRFPYRVGETLDFVVRAELSTFRQNTEVALKVCDARPSAFAQDQFFRAKTCYEKIRRGEPVSRALLGRTAPDREEAARVYRLLKQNGGWKIDLDYLYLRLMTAGINYCKMRILLDILEESGLIAVSAALDGVELLPVRGKADLTAAPTWRQVHAGNP